MGNKFDHTSDWNKRAATEADEAIADALGDEALILGIDPALCAKGQAKRFYRLGTPVEIVSVDMDGLQGRDPHPPAWIGGRVGTIVSAPMFEDVDPDDVLTYYLVMIVNVGTFEFADYELN